MITEMTKEIKIEKNNKNTPYHLTKIQIESKKPITSSILNEILQLKGNKRITDSDLQKMVAILNNPITISTISEALTNPIYRVYKGRNKPTHGIYVATNRITKQQYVGGSNNVFRRIGEHTRATDTGLGKSIAKLGTNAFSIDIFFMPEEMQHSHYVIVLEQYTILKLNPKLNIKKYVTPTSYFHKNFTRKTPK